LKILYILPEFYPVTSGGISNFYQNLLPAIRKEGHEVCVIHGSATFSGNKKFLFHGIEVYELDRELLEKYKILFKKFDLFPILRNHLSAAWAMYEMAQRIGDFDFVETTDFALGYIPWTINNKNNYIVSFHASIGEINSYDPVPGNKFEEDLYRVIELTSLKYVPSFITYGWQTKLNWETRLKKEVKFQLPPYECKNLQNSSSLNEINIPNYGLVIGRLQYWKGPTILCEAVESIRNDVTSIYWIGRNMPYLEDSMDEHLKKYFPTIWGSKIIHIDQRNREQTLELLSGAAFVLIPSIWDVFNMTCIEAMAIGKIVICSDNAGASILIENNINGFTFKSGDFKDLIRVIKKVIFLNEKDKYEIRNNARNTIIEKLNSKKLANQRIKMYENGINSKSTESDEWINEWLSPEITDGTIDKALDNVPLKKMYSYLKKRTFKKIYG
jgi:glycosyltransferase involved in cell wall biosynthesis